MRGEESVNLPPTGANFDAPVLALAPELLSSGAFCISRASGGVERLGSAGILECPENSEKSENSENSENSANGPSPLSEGGLASCETAAFLGSGARAADWEEAEGERGASDDAFSKALPEPLFIIVPACNEEATLPEVLRQIWQAQPGAQVLVVDDGSSDATPKLAVEAGAEVATHPKNLGYGAALTTGYRVAQQSGCEFVAQLDADGQHEPKELERLLEPLHRGEADVVIGSRFLSGGQHQTSLLRRLGIRFFSWIGRVLLGHQVTDATSGFWAMNRKALDFMARNTPNDYPDLNMIVALHAAGLRVLEIPVQMHPRQGGQSHMRGWLPLWYVPRMLVYVAREYWRLRRRGRQGDR